MRYLAGSQERAVDMQNVPKIVRERLKVAPPAVDHPDADVLTAFAERLLSEREQASVLEHLSRCGDCRDVVALAVPATEQLQPALKPSPHSWLTWPALRWGFLAVGVVVIASVGLVQYRHSHEPTMMAYKAAAPSAPSERKNEAPAPAPLAKPQEKAGSAEPRDRDQAAVVVTNQVVSAEAPVTPPSSATPSHAIGGPMALQRFPHGPKMATQWQQQSTQQGQLPMPSSVAKQQASDELSANVRVPSVAESVQVEARAMQVQAQSAPQALANSDYASANIARAKPAAQPAPASPAYGGATLVSSGLTPRWTINSSGSLERSFDQGNTWQEVDVIALLAPGSRLDASAKMANAKVSDAGAQAVKKAVAAGPVFRAVTANGAEVWAGGSNAALYHTVDGGDHWTRVVPGTAGTTLTGDITSIEFSNPQHCEVSTSTGEFWSTGDDGQTWQKQ